MYLTYMEVTTMRLYELPLILQVTLIKAICKAVKLNFTDSFFQRLTECKLEEVEIYVPDLFTRYIHIIA